MMHMNLLNTVKKIPFLCLTIKQKKVFASKELIFFMDLLAFLDPFPPNIASAVLEERLNIPKVLKFYLARFAIKESNNQI